MTLNTTQHTPIAAALALGLAISLTGCQSSPQTSALDVTEAWAKAADEGMTGVFAEISNPHSEAVTIVGGSTESARMIELHEVADGVMREKPGGFVIPADGSYVLEPGADHIMLMGLNEALLPGNTVSISLELDTGDVVEFTAEIREVAGANEEYDPGHGGDEQ